MSRKTKWIVSGAIAAMIVAAGAGIVLGGGGSDPSNGEQDTQLTGTTVTRP